MPRVGRNRTKHTRMPKGWAPAASGVIYFRPTNKVDKETVRSLTGGKLSLRLGAVDEAHTNPAWLRVVAARVKVTEFSAGYVSEIIDRARRSYLPRIQNKETRAWRARHIDELERLFAGMRYARSASDAVKAPAGSTLLAIDVQRHVDEDAATRHVAVNRWVQTCEQVWDDARRRWGLTEYNPFHGIQLNPEFSRDVLPEAQAIARVYRKLDPPMRFMVQMIRYYGRRRGEILKLTLSSAQPEGLRLTRGKARNGRPGKVLVIRWDGKLERMWARLMRWRASVERGGKVQTTAAILNRKGRAYTATGFTSAWVRAQKRAGVRGDFTFHDLRASGASSAGSLDEAQILLAHDDRATTQTIYRRGPHVIDLRADSRKLPENSRKRGS